MALRFLISVAKPGAHSAADSIIGKGMIAVGHDERVALHSNEPKIFLSSPDDKVFILGHLFSRHGDFSRIHSIPSSLANAIIQSAGQTLVDDFWGGYLAVWSDADGTIHILRDPSGALPCLYMETDSHLVLASDVDVLFDCGVLHPCVAWDRLSQHLLFYELRSEHTALNGVTELLPSVRLSSAPSGFVKKPLWSPWDYVKPKGLSPVDLRQVIEKTVRAWGSAFGRIALGVSGGLDSSIVTACLAERGEDLTCFTLATHDREGDERGYARCLTSALHVRLVERFYDLADVDVSRTSARHLARPVLFAFGQSSLKARTDLVSAEGIDAFFTGIGGDNIFCSLYSATAVVDRLRSEGPSMGVLDTVMDVAQLSEATVWDVLTATGRYLVRPKVAPWHRESLLLSPNLVNAELNLSHPWLSQPDKMLPGKATHVSMFQRIQGTIDGFDRKVLGPQINPLLAQPIVEACLSIPSWKWCEQGENRSVARQAFAGRLPEAILRRRSKGGPGSFAHSVVEAHRDTIRDTLLGGLLAQHKIIDEAAIARSLDSDRPFDAQTYWRLSELAETEAWARYWSSRASSLEFPTSRGVRCPA